MDEDCWNITLMEIANFIITSISIIVTVVGIFFSYWAMKSAKDAALNSKKALEVVDNFDVFAFVRQFDNTLKEFMLKTLSPAWTRGKSEEEIVNISAPLLNVMMDFNQIYSKLNLDDVEANRLLKDVEIVRSALKTLSNVQDNTLYLSEIERRCSSISNVMNGYLQQIKTETVNR